MKSNKKFAGKYLSFCKRLANFSETVKKELDAEIEGIQDLAKCPEAVNFAKRGKAKLRKFSEALETAATKMEEMQDSTQDLVTDAEKAEFSDKSMRKVRMLNKCFSELEKELSGISEEVKDLIEESAADGEVTGHETAVPPSDGVVETSESTTTTSTTAVPKTPEVINGSAELKKTVTAVGEVKNFSKTDYLKTKLIGLCKSFKNFSENLEDSGDIIEEITDEVTVEAAPSEETPKEETPAETPKEEPAKSEDMVEVAEGIADDVTADEFDEAKALDEVESKEFAAKESVKKLVKCFGRIKKHFEDKMDAIQKSIAETPVVDEKELTTEEEKSLVSEFKCFSDTHSSKFTKRLTKKFANFSETCKNFEEGTAKTEDVVDAAQDVADVIDTTEDAPTEFCDFSGKVKKFVKMFSEEAKATPDVTKEVSEVAPTASPEVLEKDKELDSTLATINGKIETLDLKSDITNFAKLSSKTLSKIKCFSMEDVNSKLELIEQFAEEVKNLCEKQNMSEQPKEETPSETPAETPKEETPAEKPAEETPTETPKEETTQTPTETPAEVCPKCGKSPCECEKPAEETPAEFAEVEEDELPVEAPVEEEKPAEETPAEEETPAPAEETPSDEEVILKNFSAKSQDIKGYGEMMAHLAFMN